MMPATTTRMQGAAAAGVYLLAITTANALAARYGPAITIPNAFLLIGLDLTLRDYLHEAWQGRQLALRMGALIVAGGLLAYLAVPAAGPIAVASAVAWTLASATDALVYQLLRRSGRERAVMISNGTSAAVDSIVFPTLAFGAVLPLVSIAQWLAKVLGGAAWLWVIRALSERRRAA